jgi:hypothetical protein
VSDYCLTETTVHRTRVWSHYTYYTSQPVFVLFLYLILRARQTFFCLFISVLWLQIQLSRRHRWFMLFNATFNNISVISWRECVLPDTCLYQSQARNWISINICCVFFLIIWKRCSCLFCWYWWILFPSLFNFSFNKYQVYSVWFVPKEDQIHDIPHLRRVP